MDNFSKEIGTAKQSLTDAINKLEALPDSTFSKEIEKYKSELRVIIQLLEQILKDY